MRRSERGSMKQSLVMGIAVLISGGPTLPVCQTSILSYEHFIMVSMAPSFLFHQAAIDMVWFIDCWLGETKSTITILQSLILKMHEKWFTNVFRVPRGPIFVGCPMQKNYKMHSFWAKPLIVWFLRAWRCWLTVIQRASQPHCRLRGGGWFSPTPPGKCSINGLHFDP